MLGLIDEVAKHDGREELQDQEKVEVADKSLDRNGIQPNSRNVKGYQRQREQRGQRKGGEEEHDDEEEVGRNVRDKQGVHAYKRGSETTCKSTLPISTWCRQSVLETYRRCQRSHHIEE